MPTKGQVPAESMEVVTEEGARSVENQEAEGPVVPEPAEVVAEAVGEYGETERFIEQVAEKAGTPIDVPEAEKVEAEATGDEGDEYFRVALESDHYSGEYELSRLRAEEEGTERINQLLINEAKRRSFFGEELMTTEEAVRVREKLIEWREEGLDVSLIPDFANKRSVPKYVKRREIGKRQIRSLVSTNTKEELMRRIAKGEIDSIEGIGLSREEMDVVKQKTAENKESLEQAKQKRLSEVEELKETDKAPLEGGEVWQIVVHASSMETKADKVVPVDKKIALRYTEGGLQKEAELEEDGGKVEVASNSGELSNELKDILLEVEGDMSVIVAGKDLRGCMNKGTFSGLHRISEKREGKTDIHILLTDTMDGHGYSDDARTRKSMVEAKWLPVIVDGEVYGGGANEKARLFVWSSKEAMEEGWKRANE